MPFCQVNWIAVVVGTVFNMFLGFMWYGPLFGNLWLKLIGKAKEEIKSSPWMYIASMVAGFLSALALALIIEGFGVKLVSIYPNFRQACCTSFVVDRARQRLSS